MTTLVFTIEVLMQIIIVILLGAAASRTADKTMRVFFIAMALWAFKQLIGMVKVPWW